MAEAGRLSLHVPEPEVRPGDTPDFSNVKIPRAGTVERPPVDVDPREIRDLAYSIIRVLNREGEAVGRIVAPMGFGHPNLLRWLPRITNPALVVWGERDRIIPVQAAALWMEALPDATLHLVPDAGHLVLQEAPDTLRVVEDFLSR